jgi:hypothetical protein
VRTNRVSARTIWTTWVTMSVGRLGNESAMTPPKSPKMSTGRNCIAVATPRTKGSPVRSRISQAWATACIQVPTSETSWLPKKSL